jgi:CRISPR-associated protein Cas8b/Csh1 subtype I-B
MENWRTIRENESVSDLLNSVVNGFYASGTLPEATSDDGSMADDRAEWLTHALLEGRSIPVEQLLREYVDKIADEQEQDEDNRFPHRHVKTQFAQLEALAAARLLTASSTTSSLQEPPKTMDVDHPDAEALSADGDVSQLDARRYRLKTFLDDRPSLRENPERRSAFVIGVLVGQMSQHQRKTRNQNRTVIDQYPADTITIQKLARAWPDLIQKAHVYASDVSWAGETLFPEVIEQSTDSLTHPQDWGISIQDTRFFYALGVAYGQQANSRAYELAEEYQDDQEEEANAA